MRRVDVRFEKPVESGMQLVDWDVLLAAEHTIEAALSSLESDAPPVHMLNLVPMLNDWKLMEKHFEVAQTGEGAGLWPVWKAKKHRVNDKVEPCKLRIISPFHTLPPDSCASPYGNLICRVVRKAEWLKGVATLEDLLRMVKEGHALPVGNNLTLYQKALKIDEANAKKPKKPNDFVKINADAFVNPTDPAAMQRWEINSKITNLRPLLRGESDVANRLTQLFEFGRKLQRWMVVQGVFVIARDHATAIIKTEAIIASADPTNFNSDEFDIQSARDFLRDLLDHPEDAKKAAQLERVTNGLMKTETPFADKQSAHEYDPITQTTRFDNSKKMPYSESIPLDASLVFSLKPNGKEKAGFSTWDNAKPYYDAVFKLPALQFGDKLMTIEEAVSAMTWTPNPQKVMLLVGGRGKVIEYHSTSTALVDRQDASGRTGIKERKLKYSRLSSQQVMEKLSGAVGCDPLVSAVFTIRCATMGGNSSDKKITGSMRGFVDNYYFHGQYSNRQFQRMGDVVDTKLVSLNTDEQKRALDAAAEEEEMVAATVAAEAAAAARASSSSSSSPSAAAATAPAAGAPPSAASPAAAASAAAMMAGLSESDLQ